MDANVCCVGVGVVDGFENGPLEVVLVRGIVDEGEGGAGGDNNGIKLVAGFGVGGKSNFIFISLSTTSNTVIVN